MSVNLDQAGRVVHGRVGLCRDHRVINNVIAGSPRRALLAHVDDNQVDGNVYFRSDDATSFRSETPAPPSLLDWDAWQRYYGFYTHGDQRDIEVDFDPETLLLTLSLGADAPRAVPVETLPDQDPGAGPGPVTIEPDAALTGSRRDRALTLTLFSYPVLPPNRPAHGSQSASA